jgi:uncharacterized protein (TIGR03435 family)
MVKPAGLLTLLLLAAAPAAAQTFEVASVKPAPPPGSPGAYRGVGMSGGPGTSDPTRIRFRNCSLRELISKAYGVAYYQIAGPDWTESLRFEVMATLPRDTTKEDCDAMLRNLIAQRFHLVTRRETRQASVYALTVAKNGPKFPKLSPAPPPDETDKPAPSGPSKKDKDGYPILEGTTIMAMVTNNGHPQARLQIRDQPISWLSGQLSGQLQAPVIDSTGLPGKYDFLLSWIPQDPRSLAPDAEEFGPSLFSAVQDQLGLKLTSAKGPVDILIIESADKTPVEN